MKTFLIGFFILPALVGTLVFFHTLFDTKTYRGKDITNRVARFELFWLAINKPHLFCDSMKWVCMDVEESKK
jgi:uncharacterized membrane protein